MEKRSGSSDQTVAISQAVVLTMLLLGALQLGASSLLLWSGYQNYSKAVQHEALNAANLDAFTAAIQLGRENDYTITLLSSPQAPSKPALKELYVLRERSDQRLQQVLRRPPLLGGADYTELLKALRDKRQHLIERRQAADQVLQRRNYLLEEGASASWRVANAPLFDTIDKLLRQDSFWLTSEADARVNHMATVKFDIWKLSQAQHAEVNALVLRANFHRRLNSTDEYALVRQREQSLLLLDNLRSSVAQINHPELTQRLRKVADAVWQVHRVNDKQLALLDKGELTALAGEPYAAISAHVTDQLALFFNGLAEITAQQVASYKAGYARELLTNTVFALLAFGLYLYLFLGMRRRILYPLSRLQRLLDAAADAIVTVDQERRVVVASRGAERMFGRSKEELQGLPIGELLVIDSQDADWMDDAQGLDRSLPGRGLRADGSLFFAGVSVTPLQGSSRSRDRYLLIVRDEQQRRVAETSLARSMRLLSAIHHVESLLFARSARHAVFQEVLRILLDYFHGEAGVVLALESGCDKNSAFHVQASLGNEPIPAWVKRFREMPLAQSMQMGQQNRIVCEDGWSFLMIEVDIRTVMVAGLFDCSISEAQREELQPLLGACGSIVTFYAEEDRRRASERHLREVLQLEEAIYSASPVGLLRVDRDYTIVRANRAGGVLFASGEGGLDGLNMQELFASEQEWSVLREQLERARSEDSYLSTEMECVRIGGEGMWVLFTGQLLFPGLSEQDMIVACMDISDRRTAEEAMLRARDEAAEARQQLEVAIEALEEAFAFYDENDRLVLCNQRYAGLIDEGATPTQLQGRSFESLVRSAVVAGERLEEGFHKEEWITERLRRHASGATFFQLCVGESWYQVSDHAIAGGGSVSIHADITSLKRQEADLLNARDQAEQANRAKSAFLAAMSHEIRTPMNGVLGMLELLTLTQLDTAQRDSVETIQESARTLLRLIDDILDFSKIEAGRLDIVPETICVRDLMHKVHQLYSEMAERKNLQFRLEVDQDVAPALQVDPLRLRQILQNFCSNALKFTLDGEVVLRLRWLADEGEGQRLRFEVADTGIGIAKENLVRLFEPFTQAENTTARRFGGTGLGLTICRRLAMLMGGEVAMESELDVGTVAILELHLLKGDIAAVQLPPQELPPPAPGVDQSIDVKTLAPILFVEDNPTNRKLTLKQFELLGYPVVVAENGVEAVNQWQQGRYSLVLTDCHMPVMDGYELARTIRYYESSVFDSPHIPIIACTANASMEEVDKTREAGMDDFMTKPLNLAALKAMLEKWTRELQQGVALEVPPPSAPAPVAEATAGGEVAPPVDRASLEVYSGGDWATERAILDDFMSSNDEDVAALREAVEQRKLDRVVWAAHRIKGASRMVGAMMLGDAAELLEKAGKGEDWVTIDTEWPGFVQTLEVLRAWLAAQPA